MSKKIILDLCGGTGSWSKPYKDNGYDVINITLPDYDILKTDIRHLYGDINFKGEKDLLIGSDDIYGILAAPPCPMFSFARTNAKKPRDLRQGMEIIISCLRIIWECQYRIKKDNKKYSPLKFWCLENPKAMLEWFLGKPVFVFHPFEFGDGYKKKTALWGYFNIPVKHPIPMTPEMIEKCKTNSRPMPKFDKLLMSDFKRIAEHNSWKNTKNRQMLRSITPSGFARAFYEANR